MWLNDRYKLLKIIGKGGMSSVYLAFDKVNSCLCAIKILVKKNNKVSYRIIYQSYHNEITHLSMIRHTRISRCIDIFEDADAFYLVLDYIDGVSLTSYFHYKISAYKTIDLMFQVLALLQCIHMCGIYHLDIKPQNFLIKQHRIYLIDFGSSLSVHDSKSVPCTTPAYTAKELIEGERPDASCDIYSFGITFYVLLFQCFPSRKQHDTLLAKFLLRCCASCKNDRFQNVAEAKHTLDKILYRGGLGLDGRHVCVEDYKKRM